MALTKKAKIGISVGVTIFVLLAIGGLLLYLFVAGVFGISAIEWQCSYDKIVNDIDLQPKFIKEEGLYECFSNYEGKLTVSTDKIVNNKKFLRGKEPATEFYFYGNSGMICGCIVENQKPRGITEIDDTYGELGALAEITGAKSFWGSDIYFLPNRELDSREYRAVLYCDYIVNENIYYRYAFFPNTEKISTEQAIEIFNKVFVLI